MPLPHPDDVEWSAATGGHTQQRNLRQAYRLLYLQAQGEQEKIVSYRDLALRIHRSESTAHRYVALWQDLGLCTLKTAGTPGLPGKAEPAQIIFGSEQDSPHDAEAPVPTTTKKVATHTESDHCLNIAQKEKPAFHSFSAFSNYVLKNQTPRGGSGYLCEFETLEGFARATLTYDPYEPRWEELGLAAYAIACAAWARGGTLPSIRRSADTVGWSRAQVHRAMRSLADYGYVERSPSGWSINVPFQLEGAEFDDWMDLMDTIQSWDPVDVAFLLDGMPIELTTHGFESLRQQRIRTDIARHSQTTESLWASAKHSIEVLTYVARIAGDTVEPPTPSAVVRAVLMGEHPSDRLASYVSLVERETRGASIGHELRSPRPSSNGEEAARAHRTEEQEQSRIEVLRERLMRVPGGPARRSREAS